MRRMVDKKVNNYDKKKKNTTPSALSTTPTSLSSRCHYRGNRMTDENFSERSVTSLSLNEGCTNRDTSISLSDSIRLTTPIKRLGKERGAEYRSDCSIEMDDSSVGPYDECDNAYILTPRRKNKVKVVKFFSARDDNRDERYIQKKGRRHTTRRTKLDSPRRSVGSKISPQPKPSLVDYRANGSNDVTNGSVHHRTAHRPPATQTTQSPLNWDTQQHPIVNQSRNYDNSFFNRGINGSDLTRTNRPPSSFESDPNSTRYFLQEMQHDKYSSRRITETPSPSHHLRQQHSQSWCEQWEYQFHQYKWQIQQWRRHYQVMQQQHSDQSTNTTYHHHHQYILHRFPPLIPPPRLLLTLPVYLLVTCQSFFKKNLLGMKIRCKRVIHYFLLILGALMIIVLVVAVLVITGFLRDASALCRPPSEIPYGIYGGESSDSRSSSSSSSSSFSLAKPLVEYYIHGRGNGHYSRSIAIIEKLNNVGVDVRMFIGRATMWREIHKASSGTGNAMEYGKEGDWDAKEERMRILLQMNGWILYEQQQMSHLSSSLNRTNPIQNGDNNTKTTTTEQSNGKDKRIRGITTAISVTSLVPRFSLPNAISQIVERIAGDCEVALQSSKYPLLVVSDGDLPGMLRAKLGKIPCVSISHGMTFAISDMPEWMTEESSSSFAPSRERMKEAWKKQGKLNGRTGYWSDWQIGINFLSLKVQKESSVVAQPVLREEVKKMTKVKIKRGKDVLQMSDLDNDEARLRKRRNIIVCYFRDRNGEDVVQALLREGFDVVLFNHGDKRGHIIEDKWRKHQFTETVLNEEHLTSTTNTSDINNKKTTGTIEEISNQHFDNVHPDSPGLKNNVGNSSDSRKIYITDQSLFVPFMSIADGLVTSAGSQILSECLFAQIPIFALHKEDDSEQMLNVEMAKRFVNTDQEGVTDQKNVAFGTSFEKFKYAVSSLSSSSNNKDEKRGKKVGDDDVDISLEDFQKFTSIVRKSTVSQNYFRLERHLINNGTTGNFSRSEGTIEDNDSNPEEEEDGIWHGMPDAAAIIVEIVRQLREVKYVTTFEPEEWSNLRKKGA